MYPEQLTAPMEADLTGFGFTSLKTAEEVDAALGDKSGTAFIVVNSVCGCAAANARPAAKLAVDHENRPDRVYTVFAGVDHAAVNQARTYFAPYPPSSPCMALFRDGKLVHFIERHHIEGRPAQMIAENLIQAFDEYCA